MVKTSTTKIHRPPTDATLKELYANAYCCASPGCARPLYKVDNENGIRTLNSRASHICARSEGGPRWDPNQSESDNRAANNLLALCIEHANEIDDPKKGHLFPVEKLRQWKNQQLADFDALGKQGWSIRGEDVEKLNKHFNAVETKIMNSIIDLGGKGGSAPGAGGGGGGVLGSRNSTGGDGGKGGNTIISKGTDGAAPGAGGGGAGALGEGGIGAGGGDGGEMIQAHFPADSFDSIEYAIGKGGESGKDGDDTIVKFIKDNEVVKIVTAKGGKAGTSGRDGDLSGLARPIKKEELEAGAGISTIILTEFWRFKNGLVMLLDAGWETFSVSSFPYRGEWPLFLVFSVIGLVTPAVISCSIRIKDPEYNIVVEQKAYFSKLDPNVFRIPWAQVLTFELTKYGIWSVEIISGNLVIAKLPINVVIP